MRKTLQVAALGALVGMLGACAKGTGVVEGLVVEQQRQIAIEGAVVHIESLEGDGSEQFVFTNLNGLYHFEGVTEGLNRVTVIKEGYATDPATCGTICRKFADVTQDQSLTLDFSLSFFARTVSQSIPVMLRDEAGMLEGATVDLYRGPCVGSGLGCVRVFPTDPGYVFDSTQTTDENGQATVPFAVTVPIDEFSTYYYQLRVTAPAHQNRVYEFHFDIKSIPSSLDLFLPRL
jgi:hypothetical protein